MFTYILLPTSHGVHGLENRCFPCTGYEGVIAVPIGKMQGPTTEQAREKLLCRGGARLPPRHAQDQGCRRGQSPVLLGPSAT